MKTVFDFSIGKPKWALRGLTLVCGFFILNSVFSLTGFLFLLAHGKITFSLFALCLLSFGAFYYHWHWYKKTKTTLWGMVMFFDNPKKIVWTQNSNLIKEGDLDNIKELKIKLIWYRKMPPTLYYLMLVWKDGCETPLIRGELEEVEKVKKQIQVYFAN